MNDKNGQPAAAAAESEKYQIKNRATGLTTPIRNMTHTELSVILDQVQQTAFNMLQQYTQYCSLAAAIEYELERRDKGGILVPRL